MPAGADQLQSFSGNESVGEPAAFRALNTASCNDTVLAAVFIERPRKPVSAPSRHLPTAKSG